MRGTIHFLWIPLCFVAILISCSKQQQNNQSKQRTTQAKQRSSKPISPPKKQHTPPNKKLQKNAPTKAPSSPHIVANNFRSNPKTSHSTSKTSFYEVADKLDLGGIFYLYASIDETFSTLDKRVDDFKKFILSINEMKKNKKEISMFFATINHLIRTSGIQEFNGIGSSSIKINKTLYRNISFLYHKPKNNKGIIWKVLPIQNKTQRILTLLPKTTVFASGSNIHLKTFVKWLEMGLLNSHIKAIEQTIRNKKQALTKKGINIDKVLNSLSGEYGIMLTLDQTKESTYPIKDAMITIPTPALGCVLEVSDNYIFSLIKKFNPTATVHARANGVKEMTLVFSEFPAFKIPLTIYSTKSGLLIIASDKSLANEILALDTGKEGLIATKEFKELAVDIPLSGNGFTFISERYSRTMADIPQQIVKRKYKNKDNSIKKVLKSTNNLYQSTKLFVVIKNTSTGILFMGNAPVSQKFIVTSQLALTAAPVILTTAGAGLLLVALNDKFTELHPATCSQRLKQIGIKFKEYATTHNGKYPPRNWVETLLKKHYLTHLEFFICPKSTDACNGTSATSSYNYFGYLFYSFDNDNLPLLIEKAGHHKQGLNVLLLGGDVIGLKGHFKSMVKVIKKLHSKYHYSKSRLKRLLKRAKRIDNAVYL